MSTIQSYLHLCEHEKYLEVILDSKLTFQRHIHTQVGKATGRLEELKGLLNDQKLNRKTKAFLYKMLIKSILLLYMQHQHGDMLQHSHHFRNFKTK